MALKYKILLLDIDGTTTASSSDAVPSERVVNAIQKAQKLLHVAVATGRPKAFAQPVIDALNLTGPSLFNGGSEIFDITSGKELHRQSISIDLMRELVKLTLPFGYKVYTDSDQYSAPLTSPEEVISDASKFFMEAIKTQDAVHILEALTAVEGVSAHTTTSWTTGDVVDVHVTHEHATKRYGVDKLLAIMDFTKDQAIAIGDGYNDLPLLEAAGLKVAMGNAPDEVKAVADYVAPTLDDDGVADVIERFILNES